MMPRDSKLPAQPYIHELAQLYDVAVPDWPGEIDFYRQLIREVSATASPWVLEIACGTGRVTVQIADTGVHIVGIDLSEEMLAFARVKCKNLSHVQLHQADMRSFELNRTFQLIIVPAYSFQLLLTPSDQNACLQHIAKHLEYGGAMVLHLEEHPKSWLASLPVDAFTPFEQAGEAVHPATGQRIRVSYAWSHNPDAQHVAVINRYETLGRSGRVTSSNDRGPLRMHCTRPSQLTKQLATVELDVEVVYGDFNRHSHDAQSEEAIWIVRKR